MMNMYILQKLTWHCVTITIFYLMSMFVEDYAEVFKINMHTYVGNIYKNYIIHYSG